MKTVLVWFLIVHNYQPNGGIQEVFSPAMATLEDCKRMQNAVREISAGAATKCVQVMRVE